MTTLSQLKLSLYRATGSISETDQIANAIDEFVKARFQEFKKELASVLFPETQR